MRLNELRDQAHAMAKEKGWWDQERSTAELLMLIVSEIAEATEEARKGMPPVYCIQKNAMDVVTGKHPIAQPGTPEWESAKRAGWGKPEGEAIELADALIRIADFIGKEGIDWEDGVAGSVCVDDDLQIETVEVTTLAFLQCQKWADSVGDDKPLERHFRIVTAIVDKDLGMATTLIASYFGQRGWDLEQAVKLKMEYNATRPYRHGGKAY